MSWGPSQISIPVPFFLLHLHVFRTVRLMDDFIWPEGFFGVVVWFDKMRCLLRISKMSLDSMLLILGLAGFKIFFFPKRRLLDLNILPGQNVMDD